MGPEFFVDAAGIPRVVPPNTPLQKLQGIAGKFEDAMAGALRSTDSGDYGSAVRNNKVRNIKQRKQFRTQVPTPYDIRLQAQARGRNLPGGRTPIVPEPRMGLPFEKQFPAKPATVPQAAPGFQSPQIKINPSVTKAIKNNKGNIAAAAALIGADQIVRNMPNEFGRTYKAQQEGQDVRGIYADEIDAFTAPFFDLFKSKPEGKSSLPSLKPGDDIPASLYPEGVPTGVGGGNAGQTQSQDPLTSGYIPGTGLPASVPQKESPSGRDLSRPSLTYGEFLRTILDNLPENKEIAAFAADSGFSKPEAAAILRGGDVETVIDGDKPMETTINEPEKRGLSGLDAASRAFLDSKGTSMQALRARDEALGLVYAGQNYYAIDRDADPDSAESLVKLTEDQRRDITNRKSTAQDFLNARLSGMKTDKTEGSAPEMTVPTPSEAQDPIVLPEMPQGDFDFLAPELKSKLKPGGGTDIAVQNIGPFGRI